MSTTTPQEDAARLTSYTNSTRFTSTVGALSMDNTNAVAAVSALSTLFPSGYNSEPANAYTPGSLTYDFIVHQTGNTQNDNSSTGAIIGDYVQTQQAMTADLISPYQVKLAVTALAHILRQQLQNNFANINRIIITCDMKSVS